MTTTDMTRHFGEVSKDRLDGHTVPGPDLDRYRSFVANLDMAEERKADLLLAVWRIMQSFVDRAFGDDPVQRIGRLEDKSGATDEFGRLPVIEIQDSSSNMKDHTTGGAARPYPFGELKK